MVFFGCSGQENPSKSDKQSIPIEEKDSVVVNIEEIFVPDTSVIDEKSILNQISAKRQNEIPLIWSLVLLMRQTCIAVCGKEDPISSTMRYLTHFITNDRIG